MSAHDWTDVRHVLCIRLDNMGDVLMTTPAMRALRASGKGRTLTLMASRCGAALAPFLSDVDHCIAYDAAWVKNDSIGLSQDRAAIETLQGGHYDAAVIFTVYSQSALPAAMMCHLAGIPRVLAHSRENPYRLLNPWVRESEPEAGVRHEVRRQLDLVAEVGASCSDQRLAFRTRDVDRASMWALLRQRGIDPSEHWIVAHCGASAESRRYGADAFARALSLVEADGRRILLTGTMSERKLIAHIAAHCEPGTGPVNLAGALTLGELACLIEDADLLISNNTGPVHIAAAVQTPIVDLYALTNPQHTPWQVTHRVLSCDVPCRYCYRSVCPQGHNACLNGIAPETVAQAATELLRQPNAGHATLPGSGERICIP
jgi:lipopolysaccharide heptosyltransferase II